MGGSGTLGRGLRVGILVAGLPALPWAALCPPVAVVESVKGTGTAMAVTDLRFLGFLVGGGAHVGVLTGLVLAGGLSLAARVFTGTGPLAVAGALLAGLVFPADIVAVGAATDGGPGEIAATFLLWPVMAVVAGAHSADTVGRTRKRRWLWPPTPALALRRGRDRAGLRGTVGDEGAGLDEGAVSDEGAGLDQGAVSDQG
ncbi:hypothetical protein [Streptomyces sp. MMG1121]|uniref:hypothetical protein n=1 Tax=Streptomyces sp. MMG1121 TaxID=1415544 RepID=UPI0006AFD18E|nr:hypothetical protein [Streptomyces sp. MMG1121]KOV61660.1 hypothetical protein ADK64_27010 [Streptomyces sp. MMG1121]